MVCLKKGTRSSARPTGRTHCTVISFLAAAMSFTALVHCGNHGSAVLSRPADNFSTGASGAAPFEIISLGTSTYGDSDLPKVRFSNSSGYSVTVAATTPNPLQVAVPIYVNPITGKLDSGTVSLTVIDPSGASKTVQGSLLIAPPPMLAGIPPGAVTEAFLEGTINLIASSQSSLDSVTSMGSAAAALVTADITAYLASSSAQLTVMKNAVIAFINGMPGDSIGSITTSTGSLTLKIDTATMYTSDRIIAAFLNQIAPSGQVLTKTLPGARADATSFDLDFARTWYLSMPAEISSQWLDWGKKTGSTIGAVTAATGVVVALAASTPAITAIGIMAGVVGAMGFAVSTFAPATAAAFLTIGSSIILNGQASEEDYTLEVKYVAGRTLSAGASCWLSTWIQEVNGNVSAAIVRLANNQLGVTAKIGEFIAGGIDFVNAPPDTGKPVTSDTVTYSGTFTGTSLLKSSDGSQWSCVTSFTVTMTLSGSGTVLKPYKGTMNVSGTSTTSVVSCSAGYTCQGGSLPFSGTGMVSGSNGTVEAVASCGFTSAPANTIAVIFTGGTISGITLTGQFTCSWDASTMELASWTPVEQNITLEK